jgi:hypothetical protein
MVVESGTQNEVPARIFREHYLRIGIEQATAARVVSAISNVNVHRRPGP